MRKSFSILILVLLQLPSWAARLQAPANAAFESYIAKVESRLERQHHASSDFLQFSIPKVDAEARMRRGEFVIEQPATEFPASPGAMFHHWRGSAFVPDATAADFVRVMQGYDDLSKHYQPQMVSSRLVSRKGDQFHIAVRLRQHRVITVVLDSEYDIQWGALDSGHGYSLSHSTRVSEVADVGKPTEHPKPPGEDEGFLWRINTYWSYAQVPGGLFIQCESVSLTRDIPAGLGWLIGPFIQSVPRDSLEFTLRQTRTAIEEQAAHDHRNAKDAQKERRRSHENTSSCQWTPHCKAVACSRIQVGRPSSPRAYR
jgi:hypothetical protein